MFEPLSREFLLNRGFCCKNGCLNCPYEKEDNMKDNKFEKWYSQTWGSKSEDTDESNKAFCAWQACKSEILNMVHNQNGQWQEDMMLKYLIDKNELVKEIEKL